MTSVAHHEEGGGGRRSEDESEAITFCLVTYLVISLVVTVDVRCAGPAPGLSRQCFCCCFAMGCVHLLHWSASAARAHAHTPSCMNLKRECRLKLVVSHVVFLASSVGTHGKS